MGRSEFSIDHAAISWVLLCFVPAVLLGALAVGPPNIPMTRDAWHWWSWSSTAVAFVVLLLAVPTIVAWRNLGGEKERLLATAGAGLGVTLVVVTFILCANGVEFYPSWWWASIGVGPMLAYLAQKYCPQL